jgi:hypothetical protein
MVQHLHDVHDIADGAMLGGEKPVAAPGLHRGQFIVHDAYVGASPGTNRGNLDLSGDTVHLWHRQSTLSRDQSEREERHVGSASDARI